MISFSQYYKTFLAGLILSATLFAVGCSSSTNESTSKKESTPAAASSSAASEAKPSTDALSGTEAKTTSADQDATKEISLLNVSYDPTRELYKEYNDAFKAYWKKETGQNVEAKDLHDGSGKQARSVINGLEADVVSLALSYDIDGIVEKAKLIDPEWQKRLPQNSCPYTSTIIFLVRKGNPKGIHDWNDLIKPDVDVITPNPKTSGGARWNLLAAWGYILKQELGDLKKVNDPAAAEEVKKANEKAKAFVQELFSKHVPKLDTGARGSTITFCQSGLGDVLLAWENEAFLSVKEKGEDYFEVVWPSCSILAEPPVAVVDEVVKKKGTQKVAEAYLKYLYSPEGQLIAAKNFYRPRDMSGIPEEYKKNFKDMELFTVDDIFGGWKKAQPEFFGDGGVFDQIYLPEGK